MNADGTNQINITNHPAPDSDPAWSPDGTKIAFISARGGRDQIYVMNSDGTNPNPIKRPDNIATVRSPSWSPDGTKIPFGSNPERVRAPQIYVINADGTNPVNITNNPKHSDWHPAWSPILKGMAVSSKERLATTC